VNARYAEAMLIAAIVVFVLGAAAIALGVRGGRVGSEPRCRRCDFDLTGLAERGTGVCPECGTDLAAPRATVNGRRRRRKAAIAIGVVLLVVAAIGAAGPARRANVVPFMPSRVLALYTSWTGDLGVLDELRTRLDGGTLGVGSVDAVVGAALAVQANRNAPWDTRWGGFVESASLRKQLKAADERRYLDQMFTVTGAKTRFTTAPGWRVPVQVEFDVRRGGLRGVSVKPRILGEITGFERARPEHLTGGFGLGAEPGLRLPEVIGFGQMGEPRADQPKAPPGEHRFAMEATWWVFWEGEEPPPKDLKESTLPAPSGRWSEERPIRVAADASEIVTWVDPGAVQPRVASTGIGVLMRYPPGTAFGSQYTRDGSWTNGRSRASAEVEVAFRAGAALPGADGVVAADVYVLVHGEDEQWLGRIVLEPGGSAYTRGIITMPPERDGGRVVLRPSPEAVMTKVEDGRGVFRGGYYRDSWAEEGAVMRRQWGHRVTDPFGEMFRAEDGH